MIIRSVNISTLLKWGAPRMVSTAKGRRNLRVAVPDDAFWTLWKRHKNELRAAGVSVRPLDPHKKKWEAQWWTPLKVDDMGGKIAASWATDSTFDPPTPEGLNLLPFQKAGVEFVVNRFKLGLPGTLIADSMGLGKGYLPDYQLVTPDGYRAIGSLQPGDYVFGSDGRPTRVLGVYPRPPQPMYRLTWWDGETQDVDGSHLWRVRRGDNGDWRTVDTEWLSCNHWENQTDLWQMPVAGAAQFHARQDLPIAPYLMGKATAHGRTSFFVGDIKFDLGPIVALENGRVPEPYLLASVEQRLSLFAGVMDALAITHNGITTLRTSSFDLAVQVKELTASLGGIAKILPRKTSFHPYEVIIKTTFNPFSDMLKGHQWMEAIDRQPPRRVLTKIERLPEDKETVCIAVEAEDKLFLAGRDYVVTHNTPQAVGVMNVLTQFTSILIVCPASIKLNWQREYERWSTSRLPVRIVEGRKAWPDDLHGVTIINYDVLNVYQKQLRAHRFDLIVVDECHMLANPKAQRTKALLGRKPYAVEARHWLFLTGTPILNKPIDIHPVLKQIEPGMFGNWFHFARRYNGGGQGAFGFELGQPSNLDELNDLLRSTCMIRRLKEDVLDLPPKRFQIIEMPAGRDLKMVLNRETATWEPAAASIEALQKRVERAKERGTKSELENAINALRAAEGVAFERMAAVRQEVAELKTPLVVAHLKTLLDGGADKLVVMCHHHSTVEALTDALKAYRPVKLYGPMSIEDRQASVDRFQNDPDCRVFIGSIRAAGVGITLTAASLMVFAEQDWVHGWMDQAGDRIYRIGQSKSVLIQTLVMEGSLDARMAKAVASKMMVEQRALNDRTGTQDRAVVVQESVELREDDRVEKAKTERCLYQFTDADTDLLRRAMMVISSYDEDRAQTRNGYGWSKVDSDFGHSLTGLRSPSGGQLLWQARLAYKYRRQLAPATAEQVVELGRRIAAAAGRPFAK